MGWGWCAESKGNAIFRKVDASVLAALGGGHCEWRGACYEWDEGFGGLREKKEWRCCSPDTQTKSGPNGDSDPGFCSRLSTDLVFCGTHAKSSPIH